MFRGYLAFNRVSMIPKAALEESGIAHLPEGQIRMHLDSRWLVQLLADWCAPFSGYRLYYRSRRQQAPAFALLVEALRFNDAAAGDTGPI